MVRADQYHEDTPCTCLMFNNQCSLLRIKRKKPISFCCSFKSQSWRHSSRTNNNRSVRGRFRPTIKLADYTSAQESSSQRMAAQNHCTADVCLSPLKLWQQRTVWATLSVCWLFVICWIIWACVDTYFNNKETQSSTTETLTWLYNVNTHYTKKSLPFFSGLVRCYSSVWSVVMWLQVQTQPHTWTPTGHNLPAS